MPVDKQDGFRPMHHIRSTADLLDPFSGGSMAFGSSILSVRPALRHFALRLTRDSSAADDLVQDTLVRAWAARERFEPGSDAKAWLFRIARNAFLSGARRARRKVEWDPERHQSMLVQAATQDDALYARDLRAAYRRLPTGQRSAVRLIVQDGMSMEAAADELGIPVGTLKSRVSRARTAMLAFVAGEMTDGGGGSDRSGREARDPGHGAVDGGPVTRDQRLAGRLQRWKASGVTVIG